MARRMIRSLLRSWVTAALDSKILIALVALAVMVVALGATSVPYKTTRMSQVWVDEGKMYVGDGTETDWYVYFRDGATISPSLAFDASANSFEFDFDGTLADGADIKINSSSLVGASVITSTAFRGDLDFDSNGTIDLEGDGTIITFDPDQDDTAEVTFGAATNTLLGDLVSNAGSVRLIAAELTISSGSVTAGRTNHTIDAETDGTSDDLDTVAGGVAGDLLILRPAGLTDNETIVLTQSGNLEVGDCDGDGTTDTSFTMDSGNDTAAFLYDGTNWVMIACSNNG